MKVCVAVFHTDQTIFGHLRFPQQRIVRPVVFHPGQLANYLRTLYNISHSTEIKQMYTNCLTLFLLGCFVSLTFIYG